MTNTRYHAVDHVMLRLLDVEPLLSLFGTVFDLPISWPKQTSSFATFAWVHVGNTDLEFWAATSNADLPPDSQPPLFHGFALDPVDLTTCIADLAKDGIQCKSPRPYQTPGADGTLVTNLPTRWCWICRLRRAVSFSARGNQKEQYFPGQSA